MMDQTKEELINRYEAFLNWVESMKDVEGEIYATPMAEGKWSPAEVIGHLLFWDRVLLHEIFPFVKDGAVIECKDFADYETVNRNAAQYAREEASQQTLLAELIEVRTAVVELLRNKPEEDAKAAFTINGRQETFVGLMEDFIGHDRHHRNQVEQFITAMTAKS